MSKQCCLYSKKNYHSWPTKCQQGCHTLQYTVRTQCHVPALVPDGGLGFETATELVTRLYDADMQVCRYLQRHKKQQEIIDAKDTEIQRLNANVAELTASLAAFEELKAKYAEVQRALERHRTGKVRLKLMKIRDLIEELHRDLRKLSARVHPNGRMARENTGAAALLETISRGINEIKDKCVFPTSVNALSESQKAQQTSGAAPGSSSGGSTPASPPDNSSMPPPARPPKRARTTN